MFECGTDCFPDKTGPVFYHAQVGDNAGPRPVHRSNGQTFHVGDNLQESSSLSSSSSILSTEAPMYSHNILISGANIINLPQPGVASDYI